MKAKDLRGYPQPAGAQFRDSRTAMARQEALQLTQIAGEFAGSPIGAALAIHCLVKPPHHDAEFAPVEFAGLIHFPEGACFRKAAHQPLEVALDFRYVAARKRCQA